MEFFLSFDPTENTLMFFLYLIVLSVSLVVLMITHARIYALSNKQYIHNTKRNIERFSSYIGYITVIVWFILTILKYGTSSTISIFFAINIVIILFFEIKAFIRNKRITQYDVFYCADDTVDITREIMERFNDVKFNLSPNRRVMNVEILSKNPQVIEKRIANILSYKALFKDFTLEEVNKKIFIYKILYKVSGVIYLVLFTLLIIVTII